MAPGYDMSSGAFRIGTSGYQYDHWRGVLYPRDLPKKRWFDRYAEEFDTVEINNTFYNLPSASTFDAWREEAPRGFCFALKFSRYGSHMKKLQDPEDSIGNFIDRAKRLRRRLGPVLVQLPPRWKANPERLDEFLSEAPERYRWAIEFRDTSWLSDTIYGVLRAHGAALCLQDMIPGHPRVLTADWTYVRFHGEEYDRSYSHQLLTAQARWIADFLRRGIDVYAFFNNDKGGHAVRNARDLRRYVAGGERGE